jgi:hypothetical protein
MRPKERYIETSTCYETLESSQCKAHVDVPKQEWPAMVLPPRCSLGARVKSTRKRPGATTHNDFHDQNLQEQKEIGI